MKRSEYIQHILEIYSLVTVFSRKNGCEVLHLRNKKANKDLVLRSFPHTVTAYEKLQNIRHSNLPEIYDTLQMDDGQIILEEYIDGLTVAEVMETDRYTASAARKVLLGICNALTVLHDRNIIHRDVKPENVIVEKSGRIVLIDFNASRIESDASKDTVVMGNIDPAGTLRMGTPEKVREETLGLLERCSKYPNFVLSSGCDIPPMTPWTNIDAFFEAVNDYYGK